MSTRGERFSFKVNDNERLAIANLAALLQRSQSDAVRLVVVAATRELSAANPAGDQALKCEKEGAKNDNQG
jgi:hypothetical protein